MTQSDRFAARFAVLAQKKEGAFVPLSIFAIQHRKSRPKFWKR